MIRFSYRKNKKADTKTVVTVHAEIDELHTWYTKEDISGWTEYGFAVDMQSKGRDGTLEEHFNRLGITADFDHDVPVKKAVSKQELVAEFLGIPVDSVTPDLVKRVQELITKKK